MKRLFFCIFIAVAVIATLSAGDLFSFELAPDQPLFKESISDPYAFTTGIHIVMLTKAEDNNFKVSCLVQDVDSGKIMYDYLAIRDPLKPKDNLYINMKLSGSTSLLRTRFNGTDSLPSVDLDFNVLGYLNTLFCLYGASDTLDFDGSYQISTTMRIADMVSIRFGLHHFSGHYGDETLQKMYNYNKVDFNNTGIIHNYTGAKGESGREYRLLSETEYVRDNSWIIGAQVELPFGLRVYGQCEIPQKDAWLRPFIHGYDASSIHRCGGSEGADKEDGLIERVAEQKRGTAYKALRVHGGLEYTIDISFANLILSADIQAHQDGQNRNSSGLHEIDAYSPSNPWEFEYTFGGALELKSKIGGRNTRIEALYHIGRAPATQWFYKTGSFIYIGFGLN